MARAKLNSNGIHEYLQTLNRLNADIEKVVKRAVYEGAGVIADAVKREIDSIKTGGPSEYEKKRREAQKKGLKEGLGIASMHEERGLIHTRVGFDGYNDITTEKYPKGQPNQMIARMFNSGTSFMEKQPFFERAVRASKKEAQQVMVKVAEAEMEEMINGR